jgi:hypothetical protein
MNITRQPPFPLTLSITGFDSGTQYAIAITNDYSADMYEEAVMPDINGTIVWELPDYFSRYDATYRLEVYVLTAYTPPDPIVLGDLVYVDTLTIERPYVDPSTLITTPNELADAEQYEALARAIINTITGGFRYQREILETTGLGNDYLPSSLRLNKIIRVYENDICVYDSESTDPEWVNAKEYRISPDKTAVTVAVSGIGGYNRYQSRPIRVHNPQSDSFTPFNTDYSVGKDAINAGDNYAFFPMGWDYVLVVDAGWPVIPADIQTATKMLYNDLKCNTLPYLNSYIKEYESGQFTLKFNDGAFAMTGNAIVDQILSNYPRTLSRIGVL